MTRIYNGFTDLIGNTPLVELHNYRGNRHLSARILSKIEYFNRAGSVKDRIAWGILRKAEEAGKIHPGNPTAFFTDQLANPANPRTHFETTGAEIWRDTEGTIDVFVAGVGTGGTVSGAGKFLKTQKPGLKIVVAEPAAGSLPTEENPYSDEIDGVHKVSEIPAEQLPRNFDTTIADEVVSLNTIDARATAHALAREEGIFAGASSGATLWVATQLAARPENAGKVIVAVLPDTGERYLSTLTEDTQ